MRTRSSSIFGWLLVLLAVLIVVPWAAAQQGGAPFRIKAVRWFLRSPPDYGGAGSTLGSRRPGADRPWLEIEVEYDSDPDWVDEVHLKYYVLMTKGRVSKLFAGDLTNVNVPKGRSHRAAMFLHPNSIDRYGAGKPEGIAAQLYFMGRLIDQASVPQTNQRWWEQFTPSTGDLLTPNLTPWAVIAYQHFEALKAAP